MWGGRFRSPLDPEFARFQRSLPIDYVLADADLDVNRAWARALGAAGVLSGDDVERIEAALEQIEQEWLEDGIPIGEEEDTDGPEDIHSLVEQQLGSHVGELSKRIHTGRSRNDQVATDLKLWLRGELRQLLEAMFQLLDTLVDKAEQHAALPMPGYTHLQRAQPITVGHHALAHAEAFWRDSTRFMDAWRRMDTCPLGSGALAGTPLPIDRQALATELGFLGGPTRNSLDAVAARDHACELLFAASMTMVDLSRLAEDYVFFATYEAGFVRFQDEVATGSSLMPQKRNPDAMELIRGKTGMVLGCLNALLVTLKGLPLAYDRDLQEDKHGLTLALAQTRECIEIAALAVQHAVFDADRCRREAGRGYLNATDLADLLVAEGVPFRDAHEQVGNAVNRAIELGVELQDLPAAERRQLLPQLRGDLAEALSVEAVLARRSAIGGTAPDCVRAEVVHWRERLSELRSGMDFGPPEDDEEEDAGDEEQR
jgi:argininosuccinate lyase